jgi:hypothetical protein
MKTPAILIFLLIAMSVAAQDIVKESVNWKDAKVFTAKNIVFKSDEISLVSSNCKYLEIRTQSGITGIFILGFASIRIKSKNFSDSVQACLIRFNPSDMKSFLTINSPQETVDIGSAELSKSILKDSFTHCYHSGLDAILPKSGYYALNFFSKTGGDLLATYGNKKLILFSFTKEKEL